MASKDEVQPFSAMPTVGNIISNIPKLTSVDFHRKVYKLAAEKGGIIKVPGPPAPLGKGTIVAVTDPLILREIAAEEFTGVTKPPGLYKVFATLCSNAQPEPTYPVLATDDEKKWKAIHSGFAPAFSEEAVVQYLPQLVQESDKVLSQVIPGELDIFELVGRINLSTTGKVMFGYDAFECTDLKQPATFWKEVITARKGAVDGTRSLIIGAEQRLCPFRPGPQAFTTNLHAVYKKYEEIYSHLDASQGPRTPTADGRSTSPTQNLPTIVQAFSTTRDPEYPDCPMNKEDTIATIGNLVVAGTLPASTAATYTLCLIACHAEVQAKVFDELHAVGLSYGRRHFAASDVAKLPYLAKVIKESMRVNPAIPQVNRQTTKDVVLGGYQVPKGTLLFLSLGGMHTSPFNFAEPGKFKPERWESVQKAPKDDLHPKASFVGNLRDLDGSFMPFSQGSRACLGRHWARLAIMATVANILSRFELLSPRNMSVDSLAAGETFSVSIYPKEPLLLTLKKRTPLS